MQPVNISTRHGGLPKPTFIARPQRSSRKSFVVRAQTAGYVAPSGRTGATELQALERYSEVVPDIVLTQAVQNVEKPKAATAARSILAGIMANAAGFGKYKFAIEQARYYKMNDTVAGPERTALQVDKALANVGALMLESVSGRVSVEVDPRFAHDTSKLVARGHQLLSLFKDIGVSKDRILLRMPATWEAIQAAKQLEAEGVACHLIDVYSFVQAAAAAQAGVSVIQINAGRIEDWYERNPGMIRDPAAPREARAIAMAGYGAAERNPGLLLIEKVYAYVKQTFPKTKLMASGLRTKQETLAVAGCDYLVVGPRVLEALQASTTLEGYNDGLRASVDDSDSVAGPRLTADFAAAYEFDPIETKPVGGKDAFDDLLGLAGRQLLQESVQRLIDDANRLEPLFLNQVGGQE